MEPEKPCEAPQSSIDEKTPLINTAIVGRKPSESGSHSPDNLRTYWWRWIVLCVFALNLAMTNIIWIPSAPIANTITCYYDVSLFWVNALSEVYMLTYIILLFPAMWMLDKYGLRLSVMLGAGFDAAGAALKLAGTGQTAHALVLTYSITY